MKSENQNPAESLPVASAGGVKDKPDVAAPKAKPRLDKAAAKRLFWFCSPEFPRIAVGISALAVNAITNLSFPALMGKVVDGLGHQEGSEGKQFRVITASIFVVGGLASWVRLYCMGTATASIKNRLNKELFNSCIDRDLETYDKTTTGELITIFERDTVEAALAFTEKLSSALRSLNSAVNGSILLWASSPLLCGVSLSVVPIVGIGAMMMSKFAKKFDGALRSLEGKMVSFVIERIYGISTVKLNQQEQIEKDFFDKISDDSLAISSNASFNQGAFNGFIGLTTNISLAAILTVGGRLVAEGKLTTGTLTKFVMQSAFVGLGFAGLSTIYSDFVKCFDAARRVFDAIDVSESKSTAIQSQETSAFEVKLEESVKCNNLSFQNVTYTYSSRPDSVVLSNISLDIAPNKMTVIVGPSGSGKSTMLSLLCGLYKSYEGKIILNDVALAEATTSFIRNHMGVVEQRPLLLSGSISQNISYGKSDATSSEILTAAKLANANLFIELFPNKYETEVGERGSQLSGGQQARIALARALIRDPAVLVLDEVTAALDTENEIAIANTLKDLCSKHGKTVIIFTHSKGLIDIADKVYRIEKGKIIE